MKTAVLGLIISFVSVSASAATLRDFVGKYKTGECSTGPSRVYVSLVKNKNKQAVGLDISFYADDASGYTLKVGKEIRENPNFRLGNPVKSTTTEGILSKNALTVTTTYTYKDGTTSVSSKESITLTEYGAMFEVAESDLAEKCELILVK